MITRCQADDIDLIVTSTYRDEVSLAALYAQRRTVPGEIVTNAKPVWNTAGEARMPLEKIGALGESVGLECAGRWKTFREFPHFQYAGRLLRGWS